MSRHSVGCHDRQARFQSIATVANGNSGGKFSELPPSGPHWKFTFGMPVLAGKAVLGLAVFQLAVARHQAGPSHSLPSQAGRPSQPVAEELVQARIDWESSDGYDIVGHLGSGRYSHVFDGVRCRDNVSVAIKVLKPAPFWKVRREVQVLRTLAGGPHIVRLLGTCCYTKEPAELATLDDAEANHRPPKEGRKGRKRPGGERRAPIYSLVFEHCGSRARRLSHSAQPALLPLSDFEIRWCMYQLLEALDYSHGCSIMHRDVKPSNVLVRGRGARTRCVVDPPPLLAVFSHSQNWATDSH